MEPGLLSPRFCIVSASIGAGHDGAARELGRRLVAAGYRVDTLDFVELLGRMLGPAVRRAYAGQLRVAPRSWGTLLRSLERSARLSTVTTGAVGLTTRRAVRDAIGPDVAAVISTYPLASQVLGQMRQTGRLAAPVITYLTDMSVHRLWVGDGIDQHLALHEVAAGQARRLGAERVEVCRPAVRPEFAPVPAPARRQAIRARFGLPGDKPLALVVAGSWGVGQVAQAAQEIAATGLYLPVTVCGQNAALHRHLRAQQVGIAIGWVDAMAELVGASDLVVQNAGGLTSLEAMSARVPVVSYRCLPGHGSTNAAALHQAGLATWIRSPDELAPTLAAMRDGRLAARQATAVAALLASPDPISRILAVARAGTAVRSGEPR